VTAETRVGRQSKSLKSYLPIPEWLPKYKASWLRPDLLAGLTVVALLVPKGMAYAAQTRRVQPWFRPTCWKQISQVPRWTGRICSRPC
jgi:hypothetical protein